MTPYDGPQDEDAYGKGYGEDGQWLAVPCAVCDAETHLRCGVCRYAVCHNCGDCPNGCDGVADEMSAAPAPQAADAAPGRGRMACLETPVAAESCYVRFGPAGRATMRSREIGFTVRGERLIADVDADGRIVGIEVIGSGKSCQGSDATHTPPAPPQPPKGESMEHGQFRIGDRFWTATGEWQCTDVGTRTIVAVQIDAKVIADPSWLNGPPYALGEQAFDEYDFEGCYPTAAERDEDTGA